MSLFSFFEYSWLTQLVLVLLMIMSVGSWYIIIYKLLGLSRARKRIITDIREFTDARDMASAMQLISREPTSIYEVSQNAVRELKRIENIKTDNRTKAKLAKENLTRALDQGVNWEARKLQNGMSLLGTCANASPYIGLFGTVWGIMLSFHGIGAAKSVNLATVAPGMVEALIATVFGLAVAIPASMAYNLIQGLIGKIETELVNFSSIFLNRIQRELPWIVTSDDA